MLNKCFIILIDLNNDNLKTFLPNRHGHFSDENTMRSIGTLLKTVCDKNIRISYYSGFKEV